MTAVRNISSAMLTGIADPNVRKIVGMIIDTNAVRNGDVGKGDEAFVTMGDLLGGGDKSKAIASAMARPIAQMIESPDPDKTALADALERRILASASWQMMFNRIELITAPDTRAGSISNRLLLEAKSRGAAITEVSRAVQQANESLAETTRTLTAAIGKSAAAIESIERTQVTVSEALAETRRTLIAGIDKNAAAIIDEARARVTEREAAAEVVSRLTVRVESNAGEIQRVERTQVTATDALTEQQASYVAETGRTISGIQQQLSVKTNNDNALAQALNTLWTRIGANTALVQTGSEIVANNVGSVVTKFEQLQSVVTDPTTGLVASYAALRTEYSVTNDKLNGMAAKWSVKLDVNGYIAGLSLNAGTTPDGKSEAMFLIAADVFAVGAPGKPNIVPFAIDAQTGLVAIRGDMVVRNSITADKLAVNLIKAGSALIEDAAITNAKIADAAITRAKIGDAQVDTLKIAGNAVTAAASASGRDVCSIQFTAMGVPIWITASAKGEWRNNGGTTQWAYITVRVFRNGAELNSASHQNVIDMDGVTGYPYGITTSFIDYPPPGTHTYTFDAREAFQVPSQPTSVYGALLETRR